MMQGLQVSGDTIFVMSCLMGFLIGYPVGVLLAIGLIKLWTTTLPWLRGKLSHWLAVRRAGGREAYEAAQKKQASRTTSLMVEMFTLVNDFWPHRPKE